MTWIDFLWPMVTGACVTMGLIHLWLGLRRSPGTAHLLFALNAFVVAAYSCFEHALTRADTPERYLEILRWMDIVGGGGIVVSLGAFVWVFFGTGRKWLMWLATGVMAVSLIPDLSPVPRLVFLQLEGITIRPSFGGGTFAFAEGIRNPWNAVFYLGVFLILGFVTDASVTLWRQGARRRAAVVGGTIVFFILFAGVHSALVDAGLVRTPYLFSFAYMAILVAMGLELSLDVFRAKQLAEDLRESETRMALAAEAAGFGMWIWHIEDGRVLGSDKWLEIFGFQAGEKIDFDGVMDRIHPADHPAVNAAIRHALESQGDYACDFRVTLPAGGQKWLASCGRVFPKSPAEPARMMGTITDISQRKQAELELHERSDELAHLSRVTLLGELSGSLAHELNQPLTAILSNAQAAEFYLAAEVPDLALVKEILADIVTEDERAGDVIRRLRLLLRKGEIQHQSLDTNQVVATVLKLAHNDLARQGITVATVFSPDLAPIRCDDVQLQQVLLNFVMNACDAMAGNAADDRLLTVRTCAAGEDGMRIEVSDNGRGLPNGGELQAFERYFTTKPHGLGIGLSVCRTIITAHGGKLGAANNQERGATFYCSLPLAKEGES
jgi:PAS domain S-box-containing protein